MTFRYKILPTKINSNLKTNKILDILIINEELYVSFANKKKIIAIIGIYQKLK